MCNGNGENCRTHKGINREDGDGEYLPLDQHIIFLLTIGGYVSLKDGGDEKKEKGLREVILLLRDDDVRRENLQTRVSNYIILKSKTMALHLRYIFWYVSLLYLRKTKSVSARTDVKNNSVSHLQLSYSKKRAL